MVKLVCKSSAVLYKSNALLAETTAARLLHKSTPITTPDDAESEEADSSALATPESRPSGKTSPESASAQLVETLAKPETLNEMILNILQLLQILFATLPSNSTLRQELQCTFRTPIVDLRDRSAGAVLEKARQLEEQM